MTDRTRLPTRLAVAAVIAAAVAVIYRPVVHAYFFNDDFQWLGDASVFHPANMLRLERYDHFYRPMIEMYFSAGYRLFGCNASAFHLSSIAIHLANTAVLAMLAGSLTGSFAFASLTALFFAVQPSFVEAVAWVGAITDLLPAFWYMLTLWLFLLFLQRGRGGYYLAALAAFVACLLTHESAATLLLMMGALEATMMAGRGEFGVTAFAQRLGKYLPFAALLAAGLSIAYVVNSRSYLIREGHYQLGWHAVLHTLQYIVALYVGKQDLVSFAMIVAVVAALLAFGTARVRFSVLWMLVTIAPASLFTWGNTSRYLYLPAAGFAMLLAEMIVGLQTLRVPRWSPQARSVAAGVITAVLAIRFAVFAAKGGAEFPARTEVYRRYVESVRQASPSPPASGTIALTSADLRPVPPLYRDPAARTAYCMADVHVVER
jgi:hypothetical protein